MERYDPQSIEAKWQKVWADERSFHVPNPDPAELAADRRASRTSSRCCRTRRATCTWATRSTTRSATSSRTCAAARECRSCARWGTTRSGSRPRTPRSRRAGIPAPSPSATSTSIREQMHRMGWAIDWGREISTHDPAYYRWTQWLFLRFYEKGLAYRKEAPVKWCPERPDGARQRAGDRRSLRALRRRGRGEDPDAVVLPDHRLCRRAARRDGDARGMAGTRPDDAAELDRPLPRRPRRLSRRGNRARSCPSSRPGRTRCSGRPSSCWRRRTRWSRSSSPARSTRPRCSTTCVTPPPARRSSARRRRRTASSPGGSPSTRSTASRSRSGWPTTC